MSKNNNWKQTDNEKLWGSAGLTDDFLLVPKELFRRRRDLDLTLADVYFILAVQSLRREGLDPYSNLIGLDPKTITKVKKHLRALGLMEDESSKPNPKHEFRVIPRYYFQGLCNKLLALRNGEVAAIPEKKSAEPTQPPAVQTPAKVVENIVTAERLRQLFLERCQGTNTAPTDEEWQEYQASYQEYLLQRQKKANGKSHHTLQTEVNQVKEYRS